LVETAKRKKKKETQGVDDVFLAQNGDYLSPFNARLAGSLFRVLGVTPNGQPGIERLAD